MVKTTDLAMIFIAILLPIVVVVYVNISFLQKKDEETLYYINIINSAINDATYAMKNVESEEQDLDYGYSGLSDKRVSVNANIAIDTFFESLYDNFEINGDMVSEAYIKSHVPALAVVDYNGVYIYSIDNYTYKDVATEEQYTDHILKPKRYYTYTYRITNNNEIVDEETLQKNGDISDDDTITVIFTMDDYIMVIGDDSVITGFYLEDDNNNGVLYNNKKSNRDKVVQHLKLKRSEVISDVISEEMSYAVSSHNFYSDIEYDFVFPQIALNDWEQMISNIGIIAFVQGINIGNDKLDYVAHGISGLKVTNRYYVSEATENVSNLGYYHEDTECDIYKSSNKSFVGYYMNKIDAATSGYYPCPVCNP